MDDEARARVNAATVSLPSREGHGVLVPGRLILTVTHCIDWSANGPMTLGEDFIETIVTKDGRHLSVEPYAVEPVRDIAVLGPPDDQRPLDNAFAFDEFCEETTPVPVCFDEYDRGEFFPVYILSNTRSWITGQAVRTGLEDLGVLAVQPNAFIEPGTSGGPVVNERGQLVALVSAFSNPQASKWEEDPSHEFMMAPQPHLTIPGWLLKRISTAQGE